MSEGIEYRCGCRGGDGRKLGKNCPSYGKRGHGAFYPRISVKGPDGKRQQPTLGGFPTVTAARDARNAAVAQLRAGFDLDRSQTVGEWLEEWFAGKRNLRATTRRSYRQHLDDYLIPHLGGIKLQQLRALHISRMVDAMLAGIERRKANVTVTLRPGAATVHRVRATLRSALNAAVKQQRITINPAVHVELPAAARPKVHPWSAAELGAFLDAAASDRLAAMYELVALTGLRRGEACGLRWDDVDLERGVITVRWQIVDNGGQLMAGPPKTDSGERTVDLDDGTAGVLLAHQLRQGDERQAMGKAWQASATLPHQETGKPVTLTGLVFTREDGQPLRPEHVTRRLQKIAADAGLPVKRLHDLRHGRASLLMAANVPMPIISKMLGHSSITITSDTYSHLLDGIGKQAAEAAAAMVPRSASRQGVAGNPGGSGDSRHGGADGVDLVVRELPDFTVGQAIQQLGERPGPGAQVADDVDQLLVRHKQLPSVRTMCEPAGKSEPDDLPRDAAAETNAQVSEGEDRVRRQGLEPRTRGLRENEVPSGAFPANPIDA